ncbi:hypothetical protein R1sor_026310 [Riccia sorocarpa]|uniref:Uncharacterized protein n=1 Tax=Riccia sorocarpa TaxID=122646 RepID=A0ABD3GCR8_9MARC
MSYEDRPRMEEAEENASSGGEEEQEEEQEDANDQPDAESDDDEIGILELFRMIRASETRDHDGPWCTEMAKIPYAHISNSNFPNKEDICFHILVENKWKPLGITAFMEDRSNNADKIGSYAGKDSNRTVKPKDVFEKLVLFEQELKSLKGKNKRKTDDEGTVKLKKSRPTHAVAT